MTTHSPDDLARALAAIEHSSQITTAKTDKASEAGSTRAFELAQVVRSAMRATAHLAEVERALGAAVPNAAGRLRILADVSTLGFAKVVVDGTAQLMLADIRETTDQ